MNKNTVISFNKAFAFEPTKQEAQLVSDMLLVWGKLEPAAAKNPALIRKGVVFGMGLAKALAAGEISLPEVKKKTARTNTKGEKTEAGAE